MPVVDFVDDYGYGSLITPNNAEAFFATYNNGQKGISDAANSTWLLTGLAAECEIKAHVNSGTLKSGSSSVDVWLSLNNATNVWRVERTSNLEGIDALQLNMEVRRIFDNLIIDTFVIDLEAEVLGVA